MIHDVAPPYLPQTREMLTAMRPLVGSLVSLGVVPQYHGGSWFGRCDEMSKLLQSVSGDLLLHGLTHLNRGRGGLVSWLTNRSDEFHRLSTDQADLRLRAGRMILKGLLERTPCGFAPPAWMSGGASLSIVFQNGFQYVAGPFAFHFSNGTRKRLALFSWDVGRYRSLGYAGEMWGNLNLWHSASVACVVLHPADVDRGFLPRAVRLVEKFLAQGVKPSAPSYLSGQEPLC